MFGTPTPVEPTFPENEPPVNDGQAGNTSTTLLCSLGDTTSSRQHLAAGLTAWNSDHGSSLPISQTLQIICRAPLDERSAYTDRQDPTNQSTDAIDHNGPGLLGIDLWLGAGFEFCEWHQRPPDWSRK